jgi:hypothetical protein
MSLSRRAKRGIAIFNKIQMTGKRALYHMSPKKMISLNAVPPADPKLVSAATEAMEILVDNREKRNAKLSEVPNEEINPVAPVPEVGTEQGISDQPEVG